MERTTGRARVGPRYVEATGRRLLYGRDFTAADAVSPARIALVNESFARKFFGAVDCVGRPFRLIGQSQVFSVVGVVADALDRGPKSPTERVVFTLLSQEFTAGASVSVRSATIGPALISAVQAVVKQMDANVPLRGIQTVDAFVGEQLNREKALAVLSACFGVLALLLVAIGLYGLIAGAVAARTQEIGIRLALGAQRAGVVWLVSRESLALVLAGGCVGLAAGAFLTRFVRSQLFGIAPGDPSAYFAASAALLAAAALAAYLPARRASRIDPLVALRYE
jgi:ABC-type antimicrobial peptide transport system permease subunit